MGQQHGFFPTDHMITHAKRTETASTVGAYATPNAFRSQRHNTIIPPRPELDRNLERVLDQNRAQLHTHPVPSVVLSVTACHSVGVIRFSILSEGHRASHETVQEHGTLMSGAATHD